MDDFKLDEYVYFKFSIIDNFKNYNSVKSFPKYEGKFKNITSGSANLYRRQCNLIISACIGDLNFYNTCSSIAAFIEHLQNEVDTIEKSKKCNFLNYKINGEVRKLKNGSYNNVGFYNKFINEYKNNSYDLKFTCKKNIGYLIEDIFKKIEDLYNIYTRYYSFLLPSSSSAVSKCNDITHSVDLYNQHKGTCENDINKDFCAALDKFRNDYMSIIGQVTTKCPKAEVSLQSYIKATDYAVYVLQEEEDDENKEQEESEERVSLGDRGISVEIGEKGRSRNAMLPDSVALEGSHEMGNSKSTMTIAFSSMLVLSSASFLMYKVKKEFI
ncbi:hypothetical protein PVNG_05994 [Plasmodium vivax North Korean]|uniref:Uncharacterized protein n=1 Tax=Plasmodium vivax North Korean TaxID=1035514 RepID=A0A0J9TK45_PLAVI|nr:hypothetical protein PVNG_05994 [Plasmodium vivax North Korean]